MRLTNRAGDVKDTLEGIVHGILESGYGILMTFGANATTALIGRILSHIFMGFVFIADIMPLVTIDTTDLAMLGIYEVFCYAVCVSTPHLRSSNASTSYSCRTAGSYSSEGVHLVKVCVTLNTFTTGVCFLGSNRSGKTERTRQPKQSCTTQSEFLFATCHRCSSLMV